MRLEVCGRCSQLENELLLGSGKREEDLCQDRCRKVDSLNIETYNALSPCTMVKCQIDDALRNAFHFFLFVGFWELLD